MRILSLTLCASVLFFCGGLCSSSTTAQNTLTKEHCHSETTSQTPENNTCCEEMDSSRFFPAKQIAHFLPAITSTLVQLPVTWIDSKFLDHPTHNAQADDIYLRKRVLLI